jgi:hypothetical protein
MVKAPPKGAIGTPTQSHPMSSRAHLSRQASASAQANRQPDQGSQTKGEAEKGKEKQIISDDIANTRQAHAGTAHTDTLLLSLAETVKAIAGLGNLTLSDGVWADPQRHLSVQ